MKKVSTVIVHVVFIAAVVVTAGCTKQTKQDNLPRYGKDSPAPIGVEYIFAVHPLHNSRRYFEIYQPLVDFINQNAKGFSVRLEASKDYAHFEEKLKQRAFHFALPNPYQSVQSLRFGYTIFGKMGDDERFRGIILVRNDSHIQSVNDLRGAAISFPSATALAASMMPKYFLKMNGLDVERDAQCLYVGSQESSMMNVYLGKTKAGCTWPPPWESFLEEHPEVESVVTVRWQTEPLINNGLIVRNDVPEEHRKLFSKILFTLHTHHEGKEILKRINLSRFVPITQHAYVLRVDTFLNKYERLFGALPGIGGEK